MDEYREEKTKTKCTGRIIIIILTKHTEMTPMIKETVKHAMILEKALFGYPQRTSSSHEREEFTMW